MKFKSRKDAFFNTFFLVAVLLIVSMIVLLVANGQVSKSNYVPFGIMILVLGFMLWIYFGTYYVLNSEHLLYRNGPFRGKIDVADIREIIKGKTLWVGIKPATARNGLIIRYHSYDEIYISPDSNESFIQKILEEKNDIHIKG